MSSYRHPNRRNIWPDREAEKREAARKAEEEIRKKNEMNETNFPTLSSARPIAQPTGNKYARLAQTWAVDDEVERRMAEHKQAQEERMRREQENMIMFRQHRRQQTRVERLDDEYEDEEIAPSYRPAELDDSGWTEVKHKSYKPKRELTVEELDAIAKKQDEDDRREDDFNGHLFESNRHDHDRV
jgi:hypothetical protein